MGCCAGEVSWSRGGAIPGLFPWCQGAGSGLDRFGQPDLQEGQGIQGHTSPANHRIPQYLDDFCRKKIRRRRAKRLAFCPILVAGAAAEVDIRPVSTVVVAAMGA